MVYTACMNYEKVYKDFIASRALDQEALISSGLYFERHHIIPSSLGGDDSKGNIIALTARGHYFAHCCLAKIYGGKMWSALFAVSAMSKVDKSCSYFLRSRFVDIARGKAAEVRSKNMKEIWASGEFSRNRIYGALSDDVKRKISESSKGRKIKKESIEKAMASKRLLAKEFAFERLDTGEKFNGTQREFARHSNVGQSLASCLTRGRIKQAKGWIIQGTDINSLHGTDATVRIFKNKDGKNFQGTARAFIETFGADSGSVSKIINRKPSPKTVFGWSYIGEIDG